MDQQRQRILSHGVVVTSTILILVCLWTGCDKYVQSFPTVRPTNRRIQPLPFDVLSSGGVVQQQSPGWYHLSSQRWAETTTAKKDVSTSGTVATDQKQAESDGDDDDLAATVSTTSSKSQVAPQVFSSGYSQAIDMVTAINDAVNMALEGLPPPLSSSKISLAMISVSSLYDGSGAGSSATTSAVIPTLLDAAKGYGSGIQHVIGSSSGGVIGSRVVPDYQPSSKTTTSEDTRNDRGDGAAPKGGPKGDDRNEEGMSKIISACQPVEQEGVPCVSVTLCILPDVNVETFHVGSDDVPENWSRLEPNEWKESIGIGGNPPTANNDSTTGNDNSVEAVFLLPSPAFSNEFDDLLGGIQTHLKSTTSGASPTIFGAVASTVSSLSRARLFHYDCQDPNGVTALADGCVGVSFSGDIKIQTVVAQGAKPVGGVYQIVKGQDSTISAVALDETATELMQQAELEDMDEDGDSLDDEEEIDVSAGDRASQIAAAYAKARIPKPVLAEANFLMKTLSDDDQAFMRKTLLVGLERPGALGRTHSELSRLSEGKGHAFDVHPVASAAMKDGSVTLSLGSVNVEPGSKMRFFVREPRYAKKEVDALWTGFRRRSKMDSDNADDSTAGTFRPLGCLVFPTLDRGNKFFLGKPGFESSTVSKYLPSIPSISGFFCNGVIGSLNSNDEKKMGVDDSSELIGSATSYVLFGSKSDRPMYYSGTVATVSGEETDQDDDVENFQPSALFDTTSERAPRDDDGELILKRREVHSGRAMTVSTVEWSVAEKTATPTSTLEGFMWDKETEVDRFRERVPLANLLSQVKLYTLDPSKPKTRDWVGPIMKAAGLDGLDDDNCCDNQRFVIVPECKRIEPQVGSLRKRYDVAKLSREFSIQGAPAISINCDPVMFGGSLDDVTKAREASSKIVLETGTTGDDAEKDDDNDRTSSVPPILASDLLLYPYQLYKIRLAGADAVNLIVGALASKDLLYLTKIASSLQMQSMLTVTSIAQLEKVLSLSPNSFDGLIVSNRELEDFSFDMTGQQALDILRSPTMESLRKKHGPKFPVLVEGRVGIICSSEGQEDNNEEDGAIQYIRQLQDAGATGAIVGGGLVANDDLLQRVHNA